MAMDERTPAPLTTAPSPAALPGPAPVTTAGPPLPGAPPARYPLGGLRALAAFAVVAFHGYQWNGQPLYDTPWQALVSNTVFVEVFFVISAFLLWLPVVRTAAGVRRPSPGSHMLARRAVRLLPLYYGVILVVWLVNNPQWPGFWQDLVLHLTMTHVYSDQYVFWTDGPAWSLAVEFHFYVLVALATFLVNRQVSRRAGVDARQGFVVALPLALVALGAGYRVWAADVAGYGPGSYAVWFNPLAQAHTFGFGMLLAVVAARGVRLSRAGRRALVLAALAALTGLILLDSRYLHTATHDVVQIGTSFAATLLLAAIVLSGDGAPRWLTWQPLVFLGTVGYGIYLFHEPLMRLLGGAHLLPDGPDLWPVTAAIVAVVTVPVAWAAVTLVARYLTPRLDALLESRRRRREALRRGDVATAAALTRVASPFVPADGAATAGGIGARHASWTD